MNALYTMKSVTLIWPSDNTYNAAPLPGDDVERVLSKLRDVGISAQHQSESIELLDFISGTPTGYVHHHESFTVHIDDELMARDIINSSLPISLCRP